MDVNLGRYRIGGEKMIQATHQPGLDKGRLMLYALSTCVWCGRTKRLLDSLGVAYDFIDVDLLEGAEREEVVAAVGVWNPARSFPTLVINGRQAVVGFDEARIREALGL